MMNKNYIPEISADKFKFVGTDAKIHDQKFETKQVSYFRDAFRRFCKNKGSVVAAVIICILLLYSILVPMFCQNNYTLVPTDTTYLDYAKLLPKNQLFSDMGLNFWDGASKQTLGESNYNYTRAIGVETGTDIIRKVYEVREDDKGKPLYEVRVDSYIQNGFTYKTFTEAEYRAILAWQVENGIQVIYPAIDDKSVTDANIWYEANKKGVAKLDKDGNYTNIYRTKGNDGDYDSLRVAGDPGIEDPEASNRYRYALITGDSSSISYKCRVFKYTYFQYRYGFEPGFLFGSTALGQDILTRLASGARFSFIFAICIAAINLVIGAVYGAIEGYYGGAVDMLMERFSDILSRVPFMVVTTLFQLHLAKKVGVVPSLLFAFILTGWIGMASTVRMQFYRYKGQEYILAARTLGASDSRLMFKHIFPNSLGTIITSSVLVIPSVIFSESSLTYLGIVNLDSSTRTSVDCGITADAEVEFARTLGMDVVITDHHQCKNQLPNAVAVVDPRRPGCPYPFKELAGVGVALKVALALTAPSERGAVLRRYGELAAIGTVADVMRLTDENRALVRMGLTLLADTPRPGLQALLKEAGCEAGATPSTITVGYGLAPRINAAGRMEQARVALNMLLTRDPVQGRELAAQLCELNRLRQSIELSIFEECDEYLTRNPHLASPAIVLAGEGWHQGVVGIVASRLSEKYACPTFMICLDQGRGKGSCRSFGGFNLFGALERCAPLLEGYGGHELAAGFTILEPNIPAFREAMCTLVSGYANGQPMVTSLDVDAEIDNCALLNVDQVSALSLLEPFGSGNPKPVFLLRSVSVLSCSDVGNGRHLKMKIRRDGVTLDAIFFAANSAACGVSAGARLDLVFSPQINEYRGNRTVQLQLCDLRAAPTRSQLERALFLRLQEGDSLSRWEANLLLPQRQDFAQLWRYLEHTCAAGPTVAPLEQLLRQAMKSQSGRGSYGKALVCFHVMGERGLIQTEVSDKQTTVRLCRPECKVDLEQADLMRRLRALLEL